VDAWRRARAEPRHPLQIPGHKNQFANDETALGADLLAELVRDDIPQQGGVDDNAFSHRYLEQAEALWAAAVGADHCRFLVGGSSQGNIAALSAVARPGLPVAVDRTSHRSTHAALVITGARPVWVHPRIHPEFHIPVGMTPGRIAAIEEPVSAVFVTSPSYVGTLSDVAALSAAAHDRGVPLVVDQAWGAHLDFIAGRGALASGADVSVTSVHKALMGYSQTAVVSMRDGRVARAHLDRCVDLVATTSPSGTLFASIDATRAVMEREGAAALDTTIGLVQRMRRRLAGIAGLVVADESNMGCAIYPFKVTLFLPGTGVSGFDRGGAVAARSRPEAADRDTLVLTVTLMDDAAFVDEATRIITTLIDQRRGDARAATPTSVWRIDPDVVVTPREAFFATRRRLRLVDAVGEVSAEQFCPYPPGVPLLAPGERVTQETVEAIVAAGRIGRVAYSSDPTLETIEVIESLSP
jgi:lysine decarboxylase